MINDVISLSDFKAKAAQLLERIKESQQPIILTQHGAAAAVVQDYESFHRTQDALLMLKLVVQGEADIKAGRLKAQQDVFASLRKRLSGRDA